MIKFDSKLCYYFTMPQSIFFCCSFLLKITHVIVCILTFSYVWMEWSSWLKSTHLCMICKDKPAHFTIRFLWVFVSDRVFVKLNQNYYKYWEGNAVSICIIIIFIIIWLRWPVQQRLLVRYLKDCFVFVWGFLPS